MGPGLKIGHPRPEPMDTQAAMLQGALWDISTSYVKSLRCLTSWCESDTIGVMGKLREETYSQRDIQAVLNNAVLRTTAPTRTGPIKPERLRALRAYTEALLEPAFEHLDEGYMTAEELVHIFSVGALFTQMLKVMGTLKGAPAMNALFDDEYDPESEDKDV